MIIGLAAGLIGVGLLIGLLGGGGSLLMVPLLIEIAGMNLKPAIATALIVVGSTSLVSAFRQMQKSNVCWKNGATFGASGMVGAFLGGLTAEWLPDDLLMILFSLMMIATALSMILGRRTPSGDNSPVNPEPCPTRINLPGVLFDGFLVGAITGLVGVGGGFVIVPALSLLGGLTLRAAIGTSMLVVGMNSFAALGGYLDHLHLNVRETLMMIALTVPSSLVGQQLANRVPVSWLRRGFGVFALTIAAFLLRGALTPEGLASIQQMAEAHKEFLLGMMTPFAVLMIYWIRGFIHHRHQVPPNPTHSPD